MTESFYLSQAVDVKFIGKHFEILRPVCPICANEKHVQGETDEVLDCKNLFTDDKKRVVGQCCCYSAVHGRRSD